MSTHPFERLKQGQESVSNRFYAEQYEERTVDFLLKCLKFNATKTAAILRERDRNIGGTGSLTLRSFNEEHESFPVLLGCSRLGGVNLHTDTKSLLPAMFKRFSETPFVQAYETFYERRAERANGRVIGLVFPRKGIPHGLIIHNEGIDYQTFPGTCIAYVGGPRKARRMLFIRPFQTLVEALYNKGHGWRPES